jgi:antitoxin component YwqK of YwqJK toxin-antitoxin module
LNGKRWNGKGYNKNGKLDFEIKDGNGNGKVYYDNDVLKFEGKYENGQRNGKGKKYFKSGKLRFEGEYKNNKKWNGKQYIYTIYNERVCIYNYLNGIKNRNKH